MPMSRPKSTSKVTSFKTKKTYVAKGLAILKELGVFINPKAVV
jgi:hypothetical protein